MPNLICQECGWQGADNECVIVDGVIVDGENGQDFMLCPNCWNDSFFEKEEDAEQV